MGLTTSTSLGQLSENKVLQKFVGTESIPDSDEYWDTLFTFSFNPPKHKLVILINAHSKIIYIILNLSDFAVFYKATLPLLEKLGMISVQIKYYYIIIIMMQCSAQDI